MIDAIFTTTNHRHQLFGDCMYLKRGKRRAFIGNADCDHRHDFTLDRPVLLVVAVLVAMVFWSLSSRLFFALLKCRGVLVPGASVLLCVVEMLWCWVVQFKPWVVHFRPWVVHFRPWLVHFSPWLVHFKPLVVHFRP